MKFATTDEIAYAESILLKEDQHFEQPYIDIIECNETKDIKACPGSGKTTSLLAKLVILANKMPLENNQGICVLTHTNVAIDEIKSRLGKKADILFTYPNFFGTIQSFVDKFLAIPMYQHLTVNPVRCIDSEVVRQKIIRNINSVQYPENSPLYLKIKNQLPKNIPDGTKTKKINSLMSRYVDNLWCQYNKDNSVLYYKEYGEIKPVSKNPETSLHKLLGKVRKSIFNNGYLSYNDGYSLAELMLTTYPLLKGSLSKRFKYLFVDEMQDTDTLQLKIINSIFKDSETICQYFGDNHQAIYNKVNSDSNWYPTDFLPLDTSKRFGAPIAEVLKTICIEPNHSLTGNQNITSIKPHIIVFDNPKEVLPKFVKLMQDKKINDDGVKKSIWQIAQKDKADRKLDKFRVKAIGWVGDAEKQEHAENNFTIGSYHDFEKNVKKKDHINIESLKSFLKKHEDADARYYSHRILDALVQVLHSANETNQQTKKRYTKNSLQEYLKKKHESVYFDLRCKLAKWSQNIHNSKMYCEDTYEEVKEYIISTFCPLWGISENPYVTNFIKNQNTTTKLSGDSSDTIDNRYRYGDVEVELATVHSVKGETHIATLYLETCYYGKHEGERLSEQLKGIPILKSPDTRISESLKMAYVGMSRPIHLLCFAMHRSRFSGNNNDYPNWTVI